MKNLIYITLFCSLFIQQGFSQLTATELTKAVTNKLNAVDKYTADVLIKIDVEFIKIEERKATISYEKPDKFEIEAKGIALLPKRGAEMEYLELLNSEFTAIEEKTEFIDSVKTRLIKIIPMGTDLDIVLGQLWINEENLRIIKMQSYTKSSGSYKIDFAYADNPFDLPASITVEFDVQNMAIPAAMSGDIESLSKKLEKKGVTKGIITLSYSNYSVN